MQYKPIISLASVCSQHGIVFAVACPGSRCAPLTLAFLRNEKIQTRTFSDERSAAFIALGMADHLHAPVVLISTSGTASLNFAPALTEAFFRGVPLIAITADRPREWVAQQDGQTIYQNRIFGNHVKGFFELPQEYHHPDDQWAVNRVINDAINLATEEFPGPVHINAPFREPLYPSVDDTSFSSADTSARTIRVTPHSFAHDETQINDLYREWNSFHRILVVAGQSRRDDELTEVLNAFSESKKVPVVTDVVGNLHSLNASINHSDVFLGQATEEVKASLQPDLLITFGGGLISKNLKLFLRKHKARAHWHVQPSGNAADTFQQMTQLIRCSPVSFFRWLAQRDQSATFDHQKQAKYFNLWEIESRRTGQKIAEFFPQEELGEFEVVYEVMKSIPSTAHVHLANSMSVRYANFVALGKEHAEVHVFSNRGTSGIDGCTSTAVGHCLASDKMHILITGDMAFFYDRNAFWHNYPMKNLRVVVLNNHGGGIFGLIDGPSSLPEADEYFITRQPLTARKLCEEFHFDYLLLDSRRKLKDYLSDFFESGDRVKILEVETSVVSSQTIMKNFRAHIKKSYEG